MSEELSDLESIEEHRIELGIKRKGVKKKKEENEKPKNKKKKLNNNLELMESDSKEYVEEEEESEELEDSSSNEEEISSRNKKRKLEEKEENQGPMWSRNWKENDDDNNDNNNNDINSMSSSSAIVVNINKGDKNNETKLNDNKLINESNELINLSFPKKASFIITSTDSNNNNSAQNKNLFNLNKNNQNNNIFQSNINNPEHQNPEKKQYMNLKNNLLNSNTKPPLNMLEPNRIMPQTRTIQLKIPLIFNGQRLCKLMEEKYKKCGFNLKEINHEKIMNFLSENLSKYLRVYLLRLISISRIRNVNFHLYSNNPTGQIHYKFHTYNSNISEDKKNISFIKGKDFDILFTSNLKQNMDLIEEYVELSNKKLKFEKLSSCKEKDEENDKTKGIESSIKITEGPNPTIKLLPGRRTKKKNNLFIKEVRKKLVQTQKKEDLIKQNSNTKDTLDAFLNDSENLIKNKNKGRSINSLLDVSKTQSKFDMSSRMSDNMSNMFSCTNTNYINNVAKNEIDMNVFKYFDSTKNDLIPLGQKRRINLRDFIFMLENSNEYIPRKVFILNKASLEHIKKK
jgi:hypothetical protein